MKVPWSSGHAQSVIITYHICSFAWGVSVAVHLQERTPEPTSTTGRQICGMYLFYCVSCLSLIEGLRSIRRNIELLDKYCVSDAEILRVSIIVLLPFFLCNSCNFQYLVLRLPHYACLVPSLHSPAFYRTVYTTIHSAINSWGVETGNEAISVLQLSGSYHLPSHQSYRGGIELTRTIPSVDPVMMTLSLSHSYNCNEIKTYIASYSNE